MIIVLDEKVLQFLEKLPKYLKRRILEKLHQVENNPKHYLIKLKGRKDYKLRIGSYRLIADIEDNRINITFIGHRKNIYK